MTLFDKVKWILGIFMVFILIVATNLIDKQHFLRVKNSVVTIYEDRLVANDLIFEMHCLIQEKAEALAAMDSTFFIERNSQINENIESFVVEFDKTRHTIKERSLFEQYKQNIESLKNSETAFIDSKFTEKGNLNIQLKEVKENLYDLAKIQLSEGRRQMHISQKSVDTIELFTHIEIYMLIILAIIVQVIVIYKPKA